MHTPIVWSDGQQTRSSERASVRPGFQLRRYWISCMTGRVQSRRWFSPTAKATGVVSPTPHLTFPHSGCLHQPHYCLPRGAYIRCGRLSYPAGYGVDEIHSTNPCLRPDACSLLFPSSWQHHKHLAAIAVFRDLPTQHQNPACQYPASVKLLHHKFAPWCR